MKGELDNEMGKILVDEDVLAKYAGSAAVECAGVVGMSSVNIIEERQHSSWCICECKGQ